VTILVAIDQQLAAAKGNHHQSLKSKTLSNTFGYKSIEGKFLYLENFFEHTLWFYTCRHNSALHSSNVMYLKKYFIAMLVQCFDSKILLPILCFYSVYRTWFSFKSHSTLLSICSLSIVSMPTPWVNRHLSRLRRRCSLSLCSRQRPELGRL